MLKVMIATMVVAWPVVAESQTPFPLLSTEQPCVDFARNLLPRDMEAAYNSCLEAQKRTRADVRPMWILAPERVKARCAAATKTYRDLGLCLAQGDR